jgi:hypothetical protein
LKPLPSGPNVPPTGPSARAKRTLRWTPRSRTSGPARRK